MWELYLLLLMQAALGAGLLILIHRMNKTQKQMDEITKEVKNYISFIIEEEEEKEEEKTPSQVKLMKADFRNEEAQSSLIQSVLGEIFP